MTSMKDEIAKINRDSKKIRAITKEIKDDMTTDKTPDATPIFCGFCGKFKTDHPNAELCVHRVLPQDYFREAIENYSALKQRVKVLEEALGKIARMENLTFAECSDAEEIIYTAKVALDLQCGNCGDDGEEPSNDCPTCHGTGWRKSCKK